MSSPLPRSSAPCRDRLQRCRRAPGVASAFGGDVRLNQPVIRMVAFGSGGYLMVAEDGGIFSFGSAPFYGSLGASPPPFRVEWRCFVAAYYVTKVRKEKAAGGSHEHIEGVCTEAGPHFTRAAVVRSIEAGNAWKTKVAGVEATIRRLDSCPRTTCPATPYITTRPDSSLDNSLENLPAC